jgi:hypothetical protein
MTQQVIAVGTVGNDGTGDPLRTAFSKANANFAELYSRVIPLIGATTTTVAAGQTVVLGCNGAQAAVNNSAWMIAPPAGLAILRADIAFGAAPGVGQSFTFTLIGSGATLPAASGSANPAVITGAGIFSASIVLAANTTLAQFQQVSIQLVTSAGAAATNYRYAVSCQGLP